MAELGKLLTFMFKEDRSEILQHYNELLDNAEDEQSLLEEFGSPTKLAVTISRKYKRDERKLAVQADSKEDTPPAPIFPVAPADAAPAAAPEVPAPEKQEEQYSGSYADIIEEIRREKAAEDGVEYKPIFFNEEQPEPEEPAAEEPAEEPEPEPEPEAAAEEPAEEPETDEVPDEEPEPTVEPDAFALDVAPEPEPEDEPEELSADEVFAELDRIEVPETGIETKTNVALLILYLIFAIPVGLVLTVVLLAVGIVILSAAVAAIAGGCTLIGFAFSGIDLFADIFLALGASLALFAVGVVLLWLAIWFFIRSIGGLFRGIVSLGRGMCVKEVEVQ